MMMSSMKRLHKIFVCFVQNRSVLKREERVVSLLQRKYVLAGCLLVGQLGYFHLLYWK